MPSKILEPSKGGKGSKLNKASQILIITINDKNGAIVFRYGKVPKNLTINPSVKAITKFDPGPATPTKAVSLSGFFKLAGLNGTGLA